MENHLLRHGEAMEAELKAMGAVQLGVRRWREKRERESEDERNESHRSFAIDRILSLLFLRASKTRPLSPLIFFHSSVSA